MSYIYPSSVQYGSPNKFADLGPGSQVDSITGEQMYQIM